MSNPITSVTLDPQLPGLIGEVFPPEWPHLSKSRRARLTGLAGGLKGIDLAVFVVMAEHGRGDGRGMRASLTTLADESGFSVSPVRRALRRLEDGYWVRCTHRSRGGLTAADKPNLTSCYDVLTLSADPRPALTKSKRRAVLFPDFRERPLPVKGRNLTRSQRPTSNPVAATDSVWIFHRPSVAETPETGEACLGRLGSWKMTMRGQELSMGKNR